MVGILSAVMVVVGVIAAADLLLSFAIVRRLAALESRALRPGTGAAPSPAIGYRVGEFSMELVTGGEFSRADLAGPQAVVTFLMPSCEPCKEAFADLRALPVPLPSPLYVLIAGAERESDVTALIGDLPSGTHVGSVLTDDAITEAFAVDGFPTALVIEDGTVRAAGLRVSSLLDLVGQ